MNLTNAGVAVSLATLLVGVVRQDPKLDPAAVKAIKPLVSTAKAVVDIPAAPTSKRSAMSEIDASSLLGQMQKLGNIKLKGGNPAGAAYELPLGIGPSRPHPDWSGRADLALVQPSIVYGSDVHFSNASGRHGGLQLHLWRVHASYVMVEILLDSSEDSDGGARLSLTGADGNVAVQALGPGFGQRAVFLVSPAGPDQTVNAFIPIETNECTVYRVSIRPIN